MTHQTLLTQKQKLYTAAVITLISLLALFLCYTMIDRGKTTINHELERYLSEISHQTAYKVNQQVEYNLNQLHSFADAFPYMKQEEIPAYLNEVSEQSGFAWLSVLDQNGTVRVGNDLTLSNHDVIQTAIIDMKPGVSKNLISDGAQKGVLYAEPFIDQFGEIQVLVGMMPPDKMGLLLHTDTFDGMGFSHVIANNGDYILHSQNQNALVQEDNFFSAFETEAKIASGYQLSKMKQDLLDWRQGTLMFTNGDQENLLLTYTPLTYGDWYLLSVVPPDAYAEGIQIYVQQSVLLLILGMLALFLVLFAVVFSSSRKNNRKLTQLAFVDPITYGFTQTRFELEVKKRKDDFHPFAYISLDIRKFKLINDAFGSQEGDRVLRFIHNCISKNLYEGELVSRIYADNFNLLLCTIDHDEINHRLQTIATKINAFNESLSTPYYLPVVCGTYIVKEDTFEIVEIRDRANTARKNNGNDAQSLCINQFYSDQARLRMINEKRMENEMDAALAHHDFIIHLQPKVSLRTGSIIGAEALVRWYSPTNGIIYPNEFIPFFERNDFILKLDLYVFEETCKLLRKWIDQGIQPVSISVNVSANHLKEKDFMIAYRNIQETYQIPPELLEIELTETVVFENLDRLKQIIQEIHDMGFLCSMDDFGSGYSSLNVLKEVPVDILKLDRVFFDKEDDTRGNHVVEAVIQLAKRLHMKTVAEGVETTTQVAYLKEMQCDMVQGYVFSKPKSIEEFEQLYLNDPQLMKIT